MKGKITVLCTGDLHLGRHPTRIPAEEDGREFSPKAVWRDTVRAAIDCGVDAVFITGDVVDRENRYFEAYGAFEAGITRLAEADIPVVAVSGNHDFDVLPRMVDELDHDGLKLLGRDGSWERFTLTRAGEALVHIDGWSFPNEHVLHSPVENYDREKPADAPLVGLLHADLDGQGSEYAPVETSGLQDTAVDAWLLGHIHKPEIRERSEPFVIYPGSPQALDPGEPGAHGPWILSLDTTGTVDAEQVSLASVRYDQLEVDVSQVENPKAVPSAVSDRVGTHVRTEVPTGNLELLLARVTLTGRTPAHSEIVDQRHSLEEQLVLREGSLPIRVETLDVATRPAVDLDELADGDSPVAYLADFLIRLDDGEMSERHRRLIHDSLDAMQQANASGAYTQLKREDRADPPAEDDAREMLEKQAKVLLDRLLAQKEGRP